MRLRSTALSLAVSAVLLAGCGDNGGSGSDSASDASGSPEASADAGASGDLCEAAAESGKASEAVTVEGQAGEPSEATFETPLEVTTVERTVVAEGDGEPIEDGQYVELAFSAYDAESGEELGTLGYSEGEVLPTLVSTETGIGEALGCATLGSRVVATYPTGQQTPAMVYVFDVVDVVPGKAWGEPQDPKQGMPTVELAENGEPAVTIPDGKAPTKVELSTLAQGDGAEVGRGDSVLVQYTGVKWSDGSVFDSSWERGSAASFQTTGVVDGFRQALEGQKVGSQVLVVIPPEFGYGGSEGHELAKETLVFVVDILGTAAAQPAAEEQ